MTFIGNIVCAVFKLAIFKKVRKWRDDDKVQLAKKQAQLLD